MKSIFFLLITSLASFCGADDSFKSLQNIRPKTSLMKIQDYTTTLTTTQSPAQVFQAINNVRGWWSEQIEGKTDVLGAEFDYHYQDVHRCKMKIVEFIPNKKVVWLVEDNYFNFVKDETEWKNTKINFEISVHKGKTELVFTHVGLVPSYECYQICSDAWGNYISKSLKNLIETGKGNPNPYQTAIAAAENKKTEAEDSYSATFLIDKAPATVFNAITNVRDWWSADFNGSSQELNDEFKVTFGEMHTSTHRVTEFVPFKKIVWLVTDSKLSFLKIPNQWTGTQNIFEITTENGKTRLTFTHRGLVPTIECYGDCSKGWDYYLKESLLPYILTGKGKPNQK